jgi:glycosyltransferase involved in cell wall biosynthesis
MQNPNTPPRIGYVVKMYPRFSETFIVNEILELERRGVRIHIFSLKKPNTGRFHSRVSRVSADVTYLSVPPLAKAIKLQWRLLLTYRSGYLRALRHALSRSKRSALNRFIQAGMLVEQLKPENIAHLHAHFASTATRVTMFAHMICGIPYSFTAHAKDIFIDSLDRSLLKKKITLAEFVVTVSDYNESYLTQLCGDEAGSNIHRVYNGIDLCVFRPDHRIEREDNLVLGVGRLVEKKGFRHLIEACKILRDRGLEFRCEIVGDGPEEPLLRRLIDRRGLRDSVFVLKGERHSELVLRMRKATVFALPCVVASDGNKDGLPTVILESMAVGLPAISTTLTGIPEIIDDGKTGFVVPPRDSEALADALERLLNDPELRRDMAVAGRLKVEEEFEVGRNVDQVLKLFQESLGHRGLSLQLNDLTDSSAKGGNRSSGLRVLYVCGDLGIPLLGSKGSSVHIREFTRALVSKGNQVEVVVAKLGHGEESDPRIPVWDLAPEDMAYRVARTARSLDGAGSVPDEFYSVQMNRPIRSTMKELLKTQMWDAIYERYSLWSFVSAQLAQEWGIPYILEVNSPLPEEQETHRKLTLSVLARAIQKELFKTADAIITVSDPLRLYALERGGAEERVFVLPNGVDPNLFNPESDGSKVRQRLGLAENNFVVGFVGSMRRWHGIEILIEVFQRLSSTDRGWKLLMVGDGPLKSEIEERFRKEGLDRNAFIVGRVPHSSIPGYVASMDVTVAPYPPIEGFYFSPIKLFEYCAMGRPVVASAQGQVTDIIEHDRTGLLYTPGNINELVDCLIRLRNDEGLRVELGRNARQMVLSEYSWESRAAEVTGIIGRAYECRASKLSRILGHSRNSV